MRPIWSQLGKNWNFGKILSDPDWSNIISILGINFFLNFHKIIEKWGMKFYTGVEYYTQGCMKFYTRVEFYTSPEIHILFNWSWLVEYFLVYFALKLFLTGHFTFGHLDICLLLFQVWRVQFFKMATSNPWHEYLLLRFI